MEIIIRKYEESYKDLWNKFVDESKNGAFVFNRNYMDYHSHRFIDHSLLIYKKNKIIAILPANENGDDIISHGGLTFGFLIMSFEMKAVEALAAMQMIKEYYGEKKFHTLIYKPSPYIFHQYPSGEDLYALQRINAVLYRRDLSSVIKIKESIRFSESKRQAVTKCIKNEITISENSDFSKYWELLTTVLEKFYTKPVHSLKEISLLKNLFPNNIRLFEAKLNSELLAGLVIYDYGNTVHTQYMVNSAEGRKLGALDYINHILITEIFTEKEYYSFGISTEDQGKILNEGLVQQKEMMGARGVVIDFYKIDLNRLYD